MAILNYTTQIDTEKTAAEIQKKLSMAGAQAVMCEYDDKIMSAMSFRLETKFGVVMFRLPANTAGVYKTLADDDSIRAKYRTKNQAARVAWRILKDWIEAQLAIVDAEMAEMAEVFLPYAQDHSGQTVYQSLEKTGFKALTHEGGE